MSSCSFVEAYWWGEDFGELSRVAPGRPSSVSNVDDISDSWVSNTDRRAEPSSQDVPSPKYGAAVEIYCGASGLSKRPEYMLGPSRLGTCIGPFGCSFDLARGAAKAWRPSGSDSTELAEVLAPPESDRAPR
jgi:hypothetical protein